MNSKDFIRGYLGLDELFDFDDIVSLVVRLSFLVIVVSLVLKNYVRRYHSTEQVFTYWAFSVVTFSIASLLAKVPMELGFALGLFAVFGVLRYRTESIAIKDLTYLFIVIGLALINALANKKVSLAELFIVNAAIVGIVWLRESKRLSRHESSVVILYDKISVLSPRKKAELIQELIARTGLPVTRYKIQHIDLLRDTALMEVHFDAGVSDALPVPSTESEALEGSAVGSAGAIVPESGELRTAR